MEFQEDLVYTKFDKHGKPEGYDNHLKRLIKKTDKSKNETINQLQVYADDIKFSKPNKKAPMKFEISKIQKVMKTNPSRRGVCLVFPGDKLDTRWIVALRFRTPEGYTNFINKLEPKTEQETYIPPSISEMSSTTTPSPPSVKKEKRHRKPRSIDVATSYIDTEKLRHRAYSSGESVNDTNQRQTSCITANKNLNKNCRMKRISCAVALQVNECGRPIQSVPCNVYTYECGMDPCSNSSSSSSLSDSSCSLSSESLEYFFNDCKQHGRTYGGYAGRRSRSMEQGKYYIQIY